MITDATVQGTASYIAGSDQESGSATLLAHTGYEANIALSLSGGQRSEIHNGSGAPPQAKWRSEEHTSELQSRGQVVCRLLLEKTKARRSPEQSSRRGSARLLSTRGSC